MEGSTFRSESIDVDTLTTTEDFYMNASILWSKCSPHEWHLVGRIGAELKYQCALWCCDSTIKKSSANRRAIKGLLAKNILIKTETTDIYFVNPNYVRRGDTISVLYATARMLQDVPKVLPQHVKEYKTVKEYTPVLSQSEVEFMLPESTPAGLITE